MSSSKFGYISLNLSQSLFQQKCLCNVNTESKLLSTKRHNPCFSRNVFAIKVRCNKVKLVFASQSLFQQKCLCNDNGSEVWNWYKNVTILVLVEMSLQYMFKIINDLIRTCHNPCFSRNVFAIKKALIRELNENSHNPCFSRNVFAIFTYDDETYELGLSQSLFQQKCLCN